jgi:aquaporin Z
LEVAAAQFLLLRSRTLVSVCLVCRWHFGLTVLTMVYAIGHISGCHLNPAVSIGLTAARRFPASELPAYLVAEVLGGIAGDRRPVFDRERKTGF